MQKYAPEDFTNIQAATVGVLLNVSLVLKKKYSTIKTLDPAVSILDNDYYFYTFRIYFAGLSGYYRLFVRGIDVDGNIQEYPSGCIHVADEHRSLTLLQYKHTKNKDDVNYQSIDIFSLRTEGGFQMHNYTPHSDDTVYQNQRVQFELLYSDTYYSRIFTAGATKGIPGDFHYIIHKAWGNNRVYVNGKGYVKYTDSAWDVNQADQYPPRTWKLEVVPNGDTYVRTDVVSETTREWSDYVCRTYNISSYAVS